MTGDLAPSAQIPGKEHRLVRRFPVALSGSQDLAVVLQLHDFANLLPAEVADYLAADTEVHVEVAVGFHAHQDHVARIVGMAGYQEFVVRQKGNAGSKGFVSLKHHDLRFAVVERAVQAAIGVQAGDQCMCAQTNTCTADADDLAVRAHLDLEDFRLAGRKREGDFAVAAVGGHCQPAQWGVAGLYVAQSVVSEARVQNPVIQHDQISAIERRVVPLRNHAGDSLAVIQRLQGRDEVADVAKAEDAEAVHAEAAVQFSTG
ncbi:hypothetical protein COLO4_02286 [Corchorus olitorius]|uniref:Uncharacterized protein n=1 Tax=Corchorus olitorius TaxID=93759 RepID=A0A1R3L173_9ROSI|nr:hypothetical protein COLO4_02286 [Corchorus olitorius]